MATMFGWYQNSEYDKVSSFETDGGASTEKLRETYLSNVRSNCTCISLFWWISNIILSVIIVGLLFALKDLRSTKAYDCAEEINHIIPEVSRHIVTFAPDSRYIRDRSSTSSEDDTLKSWLALVPRGLGFILVDKPEKYNLPPPIRMWNETVSNMTVYTTSVTHQLHCLHAIMTVYDSLSRNETNANHFKYWHMDHCFDYLRQSIMCCGDTALEGTETTFPEGVGGSDGWGARHLCKNYEELLAVLDEKRANDREWI